MKSLSYPLLALPRTVSCEALDHLSAADPVAHRSRQDLARLHQAMNTRAIIVRGWQRLVPVRRSRQPMRVLELGAGDGTLLLGVARALAPDWPKVRLTLLDRQALVSAATVAAYARLGWTVRGVTRDVLDWAAPQTATDVTASAERWDLISTALFLHHFQGAELDTVLGAVAWRADRFFACEPHRAWLARAGSHLVGALGANAVTRHDAVLSVQAGFRGQELSTLWPSPAASWLSEEHAAGLFSHCFSAQRGAVAL